MFKVKSIFKSNDVFTKIAGLIFLLTMINIASAQSPEQLETGVDKPNFSYVKNGTFYLPDGQEVKHFGVNYSPFSLMDIGQLTGSVKVIKRRLIWISTIFNA
jgi:hypothetical protein